MSDDGYSDDHYRERAEAAEFRYAQEREFSIDRDRMMKEVVAALAELCDAFQQVYETEYEPAPAGENGSYHHARSLLAHMKKTSEGG